MQKLPVAAQRTEFYGPPGNVRLARIRIKEGCLEEAVVGIL